LAGADASGPEENEMHIVVCVKQVPNTTQVRINPETNTLVRDGVESIMNPFDENALEMALQLKEKHPGTKVTVLTMGPPQAAESSRKRSAAARTRWCCCATGRSRGRTRGRRAMR
jgi:electron transfer flavoprotein alpha/beta subunit